MAQIRKVRIKKNISKPKKLGTVKRKSTKKTKTNKTKSAVPSSINNAPRKRGRFHNGIHHSPKCSRPIEYRSDWERIVCIYLDLDSEVKSYDYESIIIPYKANANGKMRKYIPDFIVEYKDKTRKPCIIEVKPIRRMANNLVQKKAVAAIEWSSRNNYDYVFWGDDHIKRFKKKIKEIDKSLLEPEDKPK